MVNAERDAGLSNNEVKCLYYLYFNHKMGILQVGLINERFHYWK